MSDCQNELDTYNLFVALSLALTGVVLIYSEVKSRFVNNPLFGTKFYGFFGAFKILVGILL